MKSLFILLALLCSGSAMACPALLNFQFHTLQGGNINFCDFEGKTVLIVNTASKCGFAPQFDALEKLYRDNKDRGLVVVGFPSNDFFQELSSNQDVEKFCRLTYGVQFPMVEKTNVRGSDANPMFQALIKATDEALLWNFHKYLIAPDGKTVSSFGTRTRPDDPAFLEKLMPLLTPKAP